jgi:hypothetical protein
MKAESIKKQPIYLLLDGRIEKTLREHTVFLDYPGATSGKLRTGLNVKLISLQIEGETKKVWAYSVSSEGLAIH